MTFDFLQYRQVFREASEFEHKGTFFRIVLYEYIFEPLQSTFGPLSHPPIFKANIVINPDPDQFKSKWVPRWRFNADAMLADAQQFILDSWQSMLID